MPTTIDLFLTNPDTSLLENMVAVELCRRYGKDIVFYLNVDKEIDFLVPDAKIAIQVSYSIAEESTKECEIPPLVKYSKAHTD